MWGLLYDPGVPTQASGIALVGRRKYSITTREKVRSYKRRRSLPQSSPFVAGVEELNDPARAKVELPSAVLNAGDDHLAMMTAVYAPFAAGVEVQNLVTQYAQGLRRLELEEAEENRIARETQSSCVSAKKSYKARARRIMLRLQYAANRSKWISSPEAALYVHTEQQHWTSHNEVPMFLSRPLYQISGNPVILNDPARAKVELILLYAGDDHLAMMTAVRLPRTVSILQPLADPPVIGHLQNIVMPMLQQMQQKILYESVRSPTVEQVYLLECMMVDTTAMVVPAPRGKSLLSLYAGAARYCKCPDGCVHKLEAEEERFCCYCTGNICDCGCFACMRNKPDE